MGIAGIPMQVRNPEGSGIKVAEGQYFSSDLPIAGFAIIEADSIGEAIQMVSNAPCAIAHGVVEVWPLKTPNDE